MKKSKRMLAAVLAGAIVSLVPANTDMGMVQVGIPAKVHAAETETMDIPMEVYEAAQDCFEDVEAGRYYYRPVYWALENNITTGTSKTTFSPANDCTRAQTVTFLWRMAGEPEPQSMETGFTDVKAGSFYEKAVAWAVENGVTTGRTPTLFDPEGICNRGEFVTFLYRVAGKPEVETQDDRFTDIEAGRYYEQAVMWAVENGVTTGTSPTTFAPYDTCIRGQVVTFLHRWRTAVNVKKCGATSGDDTDDTYAFNWAIQKAYEQEEVESVFVPAGTYVINAESGIHIKSNTNLLMDPGAVLDVSANSLENYCVFHIRDVENVNISGGQIKGERYKHTGTSGEWGMGVGIYDSRNITISNMTISSNWGDGIYMGTGTYGDEKYGCDGIRIENCTINDNRRSNISIVNADNVTIDGCLIADAKGTAPQCGINIEPNQDETGKIPEEGICDNITITNTTINVLGKNDYWGQFFCFMTISYPDKSVCSARNLVIDSCTFNGDCGNYSGMNASISNTVIRGTFYDKQNTKLENVQYENIWKN